MFVFWAGFEAAHEIMRCMMADAIGTTAIGTTAIGTTGAGLPGRQYSAVKYQIAAMASR